MIVKIYNLTNSETNWNGVTVPAKASIEYWTHGSMFNYYVTINQNGEIKEGSDVGVSDLLVIGLGLFLLWLIFRWFLNGLSILLGGPKID